MHRRLNIFIQFYLATLAVTCGRAIAAPATLPATHPATSQSTTGPTSQPASQPASRPTSRHAIQEQHKVPRPDAPFELPDAATNAETDSITLRGIAAIIHGDSAAAHIGDDLPNLTSEIDARLDETSKLLVSSPSLQLLGAQEQAWDSIRQSLDASSELLKRRMDQLKQQEQLLQGTDKKGPGLRGTWEREGLLLDWVFTHATKHTVADQAQKPIDEILALIKSTQADLETAIEEVRFLQLSVGVQKARVIEVLNSVRQSRDEAFSRLLRRNAAPLWSPSLYSSNQIGIVQQGQDSFVRQVQAVVAYIRQRWINIGAHVLILIAMMLALNIIRRRIGVWTKQDPSLAEPTRIFCSPYATAVALSLLVAIWLYPQAPRLFWAVVGAGALVPTVIILRRLINPLLFPVLNALVAFYFLDQVRSIAAVVPIAARLVLLVEMIGAAMLLITFIRSTRELTTPIWKLIRFITWLWLVVFVLAAIADLIGYVSLANLLGDAALSSAYLAVIMYASAEILSGLVLMSIRSKPLNRLRMVSDNQALVLIRMTRLIHLAAAFTWVLAVLASLSVLTAAYDLVEHILHAQFAFGQLTFSLGPVIEFCFTVWLAFQISRLLRFVLEEDVYDRFSLPSGIPYAISRMLHYAILVTGFFVGISALGYDMTKFTILAGAFGVGLGFGMQNIVNNFVSGLILLFERPVKVGDVIQMDDTSGIVGHIGIRASVIRTIDSAEIIIPNGMLISSKVTNWTLTNRQRGIQLQMMLGSNSDPKMVLELLTRTAAEHPLVTKNPPPQAFLTKFAADSFSYELHFWTNNADRWIQIRSDLAVALNAALVKEGVTIK